MSRIEWNRHLLRTHHSTNYRGIASQKLGFMPWTLTKVVILANFQLRRFFWTQSWHPASPSSLRKKWFALTIENVNGLKKITASSDPVLHSCRCEYRKKNYLLEKPSLWCLPGLPSWVQVPSNTSENAFLADPFENRNLSMQNAFVLPRSMCSVWEELHSQDLRESCGWVLFPEDMRLAHCSTRRLHCRLLTKGARTW